VRYDDFIYLADTGIEEHGSPARVWNQTDARFTGGEVDLQWTFLENDSGAWTARLFGDVVRGKLTGNGTRTVDFSIEEDGEVEDFTADIALSGNLPRIAPARVGAELRWTGNTWRAGVGAVRYARQDDVAAFETETQGYTLVHANLAWHRDTAGGNAWELFLDGSNLLDEEARPHTSFLKDLAPLPGRGVTAGVRVFF
jgi:iron complex outermembrane receptor protein